MKKLLVRFDFWTDPCFDQLIDESGLFDRHVLDYTTPLQEALSWLARANVLHVSSARDEIPPQWRVSSDLLAQCPHLRCVSTSGAGYDSVDVDACTHAGIAVVNQAGGNANAVAEMALALMLSVARQIPRSDRLLRDSSGFTRESLMGNELAGKTLGLVGFGHIGRRTAQLGQAFHMDVVATDPYVDAALMHQAGVKPLAFDSLLADSDIVSVHCPLTSETVHMFNERAFARMKRGAWFISTARGGIHDEAALADALHRRHLAGAGLDVWKVEPPPKTNPLLGLGNVVATYHTGGVTHEGRRNIARIAAEQLIAFAKGERPPRLVNPIVWDQHSDQKDNTRF